VDTTIVPFLNERGKPYQYTAIRSDITARKSFEAQLREQESLARLGQMAAVVAHEVKNPLAGVKGAVEVIRKRRTAGDPDQPILREIVSRIDALNDLIQDLLLFARPRPLKPSPLDLRAVIAEIVAGVQRDGAAAQLQMNVDGPECPMVGDRELLRAAFLNLILNAVQAMSGGGRIDVRLTPLGGAFEVAISDSGPGIAPDIRDQVMQPFFTTKTQGGGLGLPIAARSIALHGGSLSLTCPPEGGTVVIARVPVKPAAPTAHTAGSALEVT
jgi:signal transduction histidine kinase